MLSNATTDSLQSNAELKIKNNIRPLLLDTDIQRNGKAS